MFKQYNLLAKIESNLPSIVLLGLLTYNNLYRNDGIRI